MQSLNIFDAASEMTFRSKRQIALDCLLILFITAVIYLPLLGIPAWDGNEPIRVIIAKGMLEKGNWLLPLLHGKPYFTKPPLMNWLIAASGNLFGIVNEWTSRLPSVVAVFLTGISVYFLTSRWLSREGSLVASVSVLSMVELIAKGRSAEIDSLFIFWVVLILLVWLNGYSRQWNPVALWCVSLTLTGIGFLAKGPQVIAYFYLTVFGYLLVKKRLRLLFSMSHAFGVLCFLSVLILYLSLVLRWVSLEHYIQMWISQITERAESKHSLSFLEHLISYPFDAVVSFLPSTLLLIPVLVFRDLREKAREILRNEILVFSLVMIIINFPLYWLLPNARFRYFLPAGPFVAIATAVLFEFYLRRAGEQHDIIRFFQRLLKIFALISFLSVPAVILLVWHFELRFTSYLLVFMGTLIVLGIYMSIRRHVILPRRIPVILALITGIFYLTYTAIDVQSEMKKDNNPQKIAEEINRILPQEIRTVYEIGYRRFLGTACYLPREVIQIDNFSSLKSLPTKSERIYFIFDTKFLSSRSDEEKRIFTEEIGWEQVYSKYISSSRGKIVVAHLKNNQR
jgi:4-amino-4-deoxy-L-arabinose transferase-like glycosyltransferase